MAMETAKAANNRTERPPEAEANPRMTCIQPVYRISGKQGLVMASASTAQFAALADNGVPSEAQAQRGEQDGAAGENQTPRNLPGKGTSKIKNSPIN